MHNLNRVSANRTIAISAAFVAIMAGCSSGESALTAPAQQGPDQDAAYFSPQPDAVQDQAAETAVGNPDGASQADSAMPETAPPDAEVFSAECQQYGTDQKITVIIRGSSGPNMLKVIAGWLNFPSYDAEDTQWTTWCWAAPGENELACIPPDADGQGASNYSGTFVEFAPAATSSKSDDPKDWGYYCDQKDALNPCPNGTFVVCSGKVEACRVENGVPSGTAEYKDWNQDGYYNIRCQL